MDAEEVRALVRGEIIRALKLLDKEAVDADYPYETGELESSALQAISKVATRTLREYENPDLSCGVCGEEIHEDWCPRGA